MTFGDKIRDSRKAKGFTQKQLAEKIGAKHNSVSDWENNKNKPDPDTIELLCGILEITPNYLLTSSSDEFSPEEKLIIKKYRNLDEKGKEAVDSILEIEIIRTEELREAQKKRILAYEKALRKLLGNKSHDKNIRAELELNAAHERTDIEVTEEMRKHDDDIMDNDNLWK